MKIEITGRHYRVGNRVRQHAERKLMKLTKCVEEPVDSRVSGERVQRRKTAGGHLSHRHGVLQATEEAERMREAINAGVEKIEKQARRARKKFMKRRRRAQRRDDSLYWPLEVLDATSVGTSEQPRIIKTNRLEVKQMTIDEAALELGQSKNEFFVFRDSATDRVSVIYRRKDANFGLVVPEF